MCANAKKAQRKLGFSQEAGNRPGRPPIRTAKLYLSKGMHAEATAPRMMITSQAFEVAGIGLAVRIHQDGKPDPGTVHFTVRAQGVVYAGLRINDALYHIYKALAIGIHKAFLCHTVSCLSLPACLRKEAYHNPGLVRAKFPKRRELFLNGKKPDGGLMAPRPALLRCSQEEILDRIGSVAPKTR